MINQKALRYGNYRMRPTGKAVSELILRLGLSLTVLAIALFLSGCSRNGQPSEGKSSPQLVRRDASVLLITVDTLRADHLSCYNPRSVPTPHIDGLASRGVRFVQAVAQVPLTTPSHASILTGTYPQVHKVRDIGGFVLDKSVPTVATLAHEAGLETAAFVGAAVLSHHYGLNRGFDTYNDDVGAQRAEGLLPGVVAEIQGDAVTGRALEWLERHQGSNNPLSKNFFLWVHYYDPHFPYDPPLPFKAKYAKDLYSGEVAFADAEVGQLLQWLEGHGLSEKTLIVLMADHGESLGDHGEFTHGVFLYDATMHIPLIMRGPEIPPGQAIDQQVRSIDVMPTLTDFLHLSAGDKVQGRSLLPLLKGQEVATHYSYMETLYPKTSMGWSELRGIRTEQWKMIVAPQPELYQLQEDRLEEQNVKARYPADADHLEKKIWEVAGPPVSLGKLERQMVDDETLRELQSLGYASAGARRDLRIDMSGPDPKDRVAVLGILEKSAELMTHDRFQAAIPMLKGIQAEDPANPAIYQKLGSCLERLAQYQKAIDVYQTAIKHHAENDQTYASIGNNLIRAGRSQEAADALEKAAEMNPTNLQNLTNLATAYLQLGRFVDCEKTLNTILKQDDHYAQAYNILGILAIRRGDGIAARKYLEKAIECDADLTEPYLSLAFLAEKTGHPQIAIRYYKKYLERTPPKEDGDIVTKIKAAIAKLEGKS
jgi:choline-sulfatase